MGDVKISTRIRRKLRGCVAIFENTYGNMACYDISIGLLLFSDESVVDRFVRISSTFPTSIRDLH